VKKSIFWLAIACAWTAWSCGDDEGAQRAADSGGRSDSGQRSDAGGQDARILPDSSLDGNGEDGAAGDAPARDSDVENDAAAIDTGTENDAAVLDAGTEKDAAAIDAKTDAKTDAVACPSPVTWYVDCDGDTFAASSAGAVVGCTRPAIPPASCSGAPSASWTMIVPTRAANPWQAGNNDTDCGDTNARVKPGQTQFFTDIIGPNTLTNMHRGDYNCDGVNQKQNETLGICVGQGAGSDACTFQAGWEAAVPECGNPGNVLIECVYTPPCLPVRNPTQQIQACR
jgi:hypothetical protein